MEKFCKHNKGKDKEEAPFLPAPEFPVLQEMPNINATIRLRMRESQAENRKMA